MLSDSGQGVGGEQLNTVAFAAPIAQASTWEPAAQFGWGSHVGWEAWHKGIDIHLAPAFNIARVPMNGRNFEYMGEDPYLAGKGAAAASRGAPVAERDLGDAQALRVEQPRVEPGCRCRPTSIRGTTHEIYLAAFETGGQGGPCRAR